MTSNFPRPAHIAARPLNRVLALALGAPFALMPVAALADSGPACQNGAPTACQIIYLTPTAGDGQAGDMGQPIVSTFTNSQTLTATPGVDGTGAIQLETVAGDGGKGGSDGDNGGNGGQGNEVTVTVGPAVSAQGSNAGGLLRFTSSGGWGGAGVGASIGGAGHDGTGGGGGPVSVTMNAGTVNSTDPATPGLYVLSQGGGSISSGTAGGAGYFGALSGDGGGSAYVTANIGGNISTAGTGASLNALGGAGSTGTNDNGGISESQGRTGGNGGSSSQGMTATVTGSITSSQADGIDMFATAGNGGNGGNSAAAPSSSTAGNGGTGGNAPDATLTIYNATGGQNQGSVQGAGVGALVSSTGGAGGNGGAAGNAKVSAGGVGGQGGNAGNVTVNLQSGGQVVGNGTAALLAESLGGNGGSGGASDFGNATSTSGNGGNGGAAASATVVIGATPSDGTTRPTSVTTGSGSSGFGVVARSAGGSGGDAAVAVGATYAAGGKGGDGGNGGTASVTLLDNASVTTQGAENALTDAVHAGVYVVSSGGTAGSGGDASAGMGGAAGSAGKGGLGNTATAAIDGTVGTTGSFVYGVLTQSLGGMGSSGGDAASVFGYAGPARNGGDGGSVYVNGQSGTVTTQGTGSYGMVGQSIGGGGGSGGNALSSTTGVAIGGNGGGGGNGGNVTLGLLSSDPNSAVLNDTVITYGDAAIGIQGQSVGGAGGIGGNAVAVGTGVSLAIGGDGASGGNGGAVNVNSNGLVTTLGPQSGGIAAQSVGGGGGNGGAAVAIDAGVQISTSFALGGRGANGGQGGAVNLTNAGQVSTYGADSYGLKAQSISGGGGQGGTALATAAALGGDPEFPTTSVSVSVGGSGGAGGDQSNSPVTVNNNGLVTTSGDGSIGIIAQNLSGGGGNGGDSTASSYANGLNSDSTNVSVSVGVGGKGGGGGTAGSATANNNGLVLTMGADAYGVFAQSVAGGGGTGGAGDSSASAGSGDNSYTGSVTVGGSGGQGGIAGAVNVNNQSLGNIATAGDGANAVFAQSLAGGGGASGGGAAKANGGSISASVTVGGSGGSGGTAGAVTVQNQGNLLTQGAEADAVLAQSIGGGGGKAGKGTSTTGGAPNAEQVFQQMSNSIQSGLGVDTSGVTKVADNVYSVGSKVWGAVNSLTKLGSALGGGDDDAATGTLRDDDDGDGQSSSLKLNATLGGQGGVGGTGGTVSVTNSGGIQTNGNKSDGIFAQSLGGGGGVGGASSFSGSASDGGSSDDSTSGALTVGGSGAGAGAGGTVQVTNTGSIATLGVSSYGISAQSVGGGGGKGGATASSAGALKDFNVTLGGSGGAGGSGGSVTVDNEGSINTQERESIAVLAQSVGGGGGTAHLLSSDVSASTDSQNNMQINLSLGGSGGAAGDGGNTTVSLNQKLGSQGTIRTSGANSVGVLAQSIGGGGGLMVASSAQSDAKGGGNGGGIQNTTLLPLTIGDANGSSGNANTVNVNVGNGNGSGLWNAIGTSGANAHGIVAQSIGGGGGVFSGATPSMDLAKLFPGTKQTGNGGSVNVSLTDWSFDSVTTSGAGAVGVLAQSIGGGGGLVGDMSHVQLGTATDGGLKANPNQQSGQGGNVSVNVGAFNTVATTGANAHGVLAQALGGGGGILSGTADNPGYSFAGSTNYTGCSSDNCTGNVNVTLGNSATVSTSGAGAWGIYAQSSGNGSNNATINVGPYASVQSQDKSAGAVYVEATGTNTVTNGGTISATSTGLAVGSAAGRTTLDNLSTGIVNGNVNLKIGSGSGSVLNRLGGTLNTGNLMGADVVQNEGKVEVGGAGTAGAVTEVTGKLEQGSTGRIVIDSDHVAGTSDRLTVDGDAHLAGALQMRTARLAPTPVDVMDVKGELDASQLQSVDPMLVHYQISNAGTTAADGSAQQSIFVTPQARFDAAASGLGKNAQSVADHLQANFNAGSGSLGGTLAQLAAGVQDPATYKATLTSLGNEAQQAVGTSRLAASHAFVERMNSCPTFDQDNSTDMKERDCLWGRVIDNSTTASGSQHANYSASTHSVQVGGQKQIAQGWFLGGSAAYNSEDFNSSTGAGSVEGNGGAVGMVLKREIGNWTISGAADFGYGNYDTTRNIAFPGYAAQATGSFNLTQYGLHSRIAYLVPQQDWYLKPYLDLHAVHMHTGSYSEQGAGALGLNVDGNSDTMFSASPMLEVGGRVEMDNGMTLRPYAAVGATLHDKNEWGADAQFQGAVPGVQSFNTAASAPTSLANVRLGVDLMVKKNLQVRAEYGGQFGSGYRSNEGILRVNYLF